jgi:TsgA-like MFS transporter
MTKNKVLLTAIAFMTYMVMSGLLTQIGIILAPFAAQLDLPPSVAVTLFSALTGGALTGTFLSLFLYSHLALGTILKVNYALFLVTLLTLMGLDINTAQLISLHFFVLGITCGIGLAGGAIIISKSYHSEKRASAFIATDCSFSAAGFIFPTLGSYIIAANLNWSLSYGAVGILVMILFATLFLVKFPDTEATLENSENALQQLRQIMRPSVILMGLGVCVYLIAQTTFLTWAPSYLHEQLNLPMAEAGTVVGNYWGLSIFGLLSAAVIVNKVRPRWLLMSAVVLAIGLNCFFVSTHNSAHFLLMSFVFGFATTCIYKVAMAVGSQQIPNAPAMLITFLLFSGSVGSTLAPTLSGIVVNWGDTRDAMLLSLVGFIVVGILFTSCLWLESRHQKTA